MAVIYEENITKKLACELLGYTPVHDWDKWKLIIDQYEVAVLGYTGEESQAYEVPQTQLGDSMFEYDSLEEYKLAGGTEKEYKSLRRKGWLLTFLPYLLFILSVSAIAVITKYGL